jgi:uncharacterized membrane protein YhaH (DUF805 family)
MEDLFEFLFGASGRISRAKYWRSLLIYCVAGLFVAVILFTAAGLAAPLFIVMVVLVLIPWLMWGFAIHTERLHDRDKSAWWLVVFLLPPAVIEQIANLACFDGGSARGCTTSWRWQLSRSRSGDLSKLAACAAPPARTPMGPTRSPKNDERARRRVYRALSVLIESEPGTNLLF